MGSVLLGSSGVLHAAGMQFRVLGSLEVETDGDPVVLGGQKERLLLTRPN
jgi:hypothetical protein